MKPDWNKFSGTIDMRYRVHMESTPVMNKTQVTLSFEVYNPLSQDWQCLECVFGRGQDDKTALIKAIKRAETKWKMSLSKEEILKTA